ncbi:hypothetical protein LGK95_08865 [Clostridium algoriphilum]|uniref:hypothetical protein n=1 Tax=Clostridium algoriphilum TaxID=198347 RepID=UPI001CF4D6AF|nr:hypothetical protein [Clostridium algoriphilum]MCB2293633.1 hypothetical protein [Clostridium algoriphilum]
MSDVKIKNFRVQEDDIKKFRGFAEENNLNQAEMITALANAFDLVRVRGKIFNRLEEEKSKLVYELKYELRDYDNSFI